MSRVSQPGGARGISGFQGALEQKTKNKTNQHINLKPLLWLQTKICTEILQMKSLSFT